MQAAAYVGLRSRGLTGAVAAFSGFVLPAFVLMVALSALYRHSRQLPAAVSVFAGLQVLVVAIVANAAFSFARPLFNAWRDLALGLATAAFLFFGGNPLVAIAGAGLAGLLLFAGKTAAAEPLTRPRPPLNLGAFAPALALLLALAVLLLALALVRPSLLELALVMIKVDLVAFGGGYGALPLLFSEVVDARRWLDGQTFLDGLALGQVTPGPIVITATFVGYLKEQLAGATVATLAVFAPSLIMLTAAVPSFDRFRDHRLFQRAMHGILVSFSGLLAAVALRFALAIPWEPIRAVLCLAALAALLRRVDILWVVLCTVALSALVLR